MGPETRLLGVGAEKIPEIWERSIFIILKTRILFSLDLQTNGWEVCDYI